MIKLDLSLLNVTLYDGCDVENVAGKLNLKTPPLVAIDVVGRNMASILTGIKDRRAVTLTGPMAVWVYLVAFHHVVHAFDKVYYDDGRNGPILIAAHG